MLTITALVDEIDGTVGDTRLIGNEHMPVSAVEEILRYTLQQHLGFRHAATLAAEGYELAPTGPEWHDADEMGSTDACWTWSWQRV